MDTQNLTMDNQPTDLNNQSIEPQLLKAQQDNFVTFIALGGLITDETEDSTQTQKIKQMTISEFCERNGISRDTYYRWKKTMPGLADLVRARRREVYSLSRETANWNRLYLIGMTGKGQAAVDAIKAQLGHFGRLELPVQRQEHEFKGESWQSLIERKRQQVIEAEIVNDPQVKEHDRPTTNT